MDPKGKHWIVEDLVQLARSSERSLETVALDAGMGANTLYWWARGEVVSPSIQSIEAVARTLGYEMELMKVDHEATS